MSDLEQWAKEMQENTGIEVLLDSLPAWPGTFLANYPKTSSEGMRVCANGITLISAAGKGENGDG